MARLAAQARLCYYPAPPAAIVELCRHLLKGPADQRQHHHILDPCSGRGAAINIIAKTLAIPHSAVYAIELDHERGKATKDEMPEANVLSPCSFFSSYSPMQSFGLIYCNPPFDDELGGLGRDETAFVRDCHRLLVSQGVLVFVAPFQTFRKRDLYTHLDMHYKDARLYRFPELTYNECVYIGVKCSTVLPSKDMYSGYLNQEVQVGYYNENMPGALTPLARPAAIWEDGRKVGVEESIKQWTIPANWRPSKFVKTGYVDGELEAAIAKSPLIRVVEESLEPPIQRPPLPLAEGHIGLQLAAGALNGLLALPDGLSHVVRGVPSKEEYLNEDASEERLSEDGKNMHVKIVYSQRITLTVRAVGLDGTIHTFTSSTKVGESERTEEKTVTVEEFERSKKRPA